MSAIQAVKSEYTNKHTTLDLAIERYEELITARDRVKATVMEEAFYELPNGAKTAHPLTKTWMELEKLIHATMRELGFIARMMDIAPEDERDEVDMFLQNIERTNRPHRSVNRGEA